MFRGTIYKVLLKMLYRYNAEEEFVPMGGRIGTYRRSFFHSDGAVSRGGAFDETKGLGVGKCSSRMVRRRRRRRRRRKRRRVHIYQGMCRRWRIRQRGGDRITFSDI